MAFFRNGVCVPLVTTPTVGAVVTARRGRGGRWPAVDHLEADDLAGRALGLLAAQHVAAEERRLVPADDPAQVAFEHGGGLVHVVAVEAHRRLEAQRVARAEAARDQPVVLARPARSAFHSARRELRRHEDLEAVLAGVAGARDGAADAGHLAVREPVVLDGPSRSTAVSDWTIAARLRPLHGDERVAVARVDDGDLAGAP